MAVGVGCGVGVFVFVGVEVGCGVLVNLGVGVGSGVLVLPASGLAVGVHVGGSSLLAGIGRARRVLCVGVLDGSGTAAGINAGVPAPTVQARAVAPMYRVTAKARVFMRCPQDVSFQPRKQRCADQIRGRRFCMGWAGAGVLPMPNKTLCRHWVHDWTAFVKNLDLHLPSSLRQRYCLFEQFR